MPEKNKAVALKYEPGRGKAPRVVAKGREAVAARILELARQHRIPVVKDSSLVQVLEALDLESEIPPELYRAVAELLVFVYRMDRDFPGRGKKTG